MVTKPGSAANGGARFCGASVLENCEKALDMKQQATQAPVVPKHLVFVG
jgi:hypothetical protein